MKKSKAFVLAVLFTFIYSAGFSQEKTVTPAPQLPVDPESKLITYTELVEVPGVNQKDLYKRAHKWFKSYYKNPADVMREVDSTGYKIVGVHRFKITKDVPAAKKNDPPIKNEAGMVNYSITVAAKDGKYRYEISKINWKQTSNYPAEKWLDKKAQYYEPAFESYLAQTDLFLRSVIEDLKKSMAKSGDQKKSDW